MAYYLAPLIVAVVLIVAVTVMVIHALNKKSEVSAGLQLNKLGFTLTAKNNTDHVSNG